MREFLVKLFSRSVPGRPVLTPGRLYFLMSQALRESRGRRQARGRGRCHCTMPLPYLTASGTRKANWDADLGLLQCDECRDDVKAILARHRALYDIHDLELAQPARPCHGFEFGPARDGYGDVRLFG